MKAQGAWGIDYECWVAPTTGVGTLQPVSMSPARYIGVATAVVTSLPTEQTSVRRTKLYRTSCFKPVEGTAVPVRCPSPKRAIKIALPYLCPFLVGPVFGV